MQPQLSNSCCFSGHRPNKRPPEQSPEGQRLRALLREMVRSKLREGCTHFYCGMARGADIWFAETVLALAMEQPSLGIRLYPMVPFPGQEGKPGTAYYSRYHAILRQSEPPRYFSAGYALSSYHMRNRAMVDACGHFLSIFDGSPGGTQKTYAYAVQKQRKRLVYDPKTRRLYTWPHKESIASILNTFPL